MAIERNAVPLLPFVNVGRAIEWYRRAFFAVELGRTEKPSGEVAHAQLEMLGVKLTLAESDSADVCLGSSDRSAVVPQIVVEDADLVCHNAAMYGALVLTRMELRRDGYRSALLEDPFGYRWIIAGETEHVGEDGCLWHEEEARRWVQMQSERSYRKPR